MSNESSKQCPKRQPEKRTKRPYIKRNANRPKRPLSAYNLFFRYERERIVRETSTAENNGLDISEAKATTKSGKRVHRKTHGAIGFAELGKHISQAWKQLDENGRARFQAEADKDKERYKSQLGAILARPQPAPAQNEYAGELNNLPLGGSGGWAQDDSSKDQQSNYSSLERHSAYDYHYPHVTSPPAPGHYPPVAHVDYYQGYHGDNHQGAPSAFVPPPNNPNGREAFSPPQYDNRHTTDVRYGPAHVNLPHDQGVLESDPENEHEFAFQCEICNDAVFSTYGECAVHEEQCAQRRIRMESVGYRNHSMGPGPASRGLRTAEADNRQQAVEAVMMLKEHVEC